MQEPVHPDEPLIVSAGTRAVVPPARTTQNAPRRSAGVASRELTLADLRSPRRSRRVVLPAILFLATCASTFFAGATDWRPYLLLEDAGLAIRAAQAHWQQGLAYMVAVLAILIMHEMGHFLQAMRYGVPASLPMFIPLPIAVTGTMGAVIGMEGSRANRRQLFDIGISGPIAGLLVAIPIVWFGIKNAEITSGSSEFWPFGKPLIFDLMTSYLRPDLPVGKVLKLNPLLMAGWVGMLVTGLNMLPVSQLDGGHVIYGLWGRRSRWIARTLVIGTIIFMLVTDQYTWLVMLILILVLGVDHPHTYDDRVRLGVFRRVLGLASLTIPIFCFTPILLL